MATPETYTRHRATADRLLTRYGGAATLVQEAEGETYDVETGTYIRDPDLEYATQFIATAYDETLHEGFLVMPGDVLGIMAVPTSNPTPKPADKLKLSGVVHLIIGIKTVQPAATVLQYAVQARVGG
jgi:hypothetical protein